MADDKNTNETEETVGETPAAEEKPKRSRKKAEPEAAAPEAAEAEAKPKRTRKKAEEAAAEPAEAPRTTEEVEAAAQAGTDPEGSVPEGAADPAPAGEAAPEEPVAAEPEPEAVEAVAEAAPGAEPATDEAATEQPSPEEAAAATEQPRGPQRGPKKKSKRLPRAQRHKHVKPKREAPAQRKPITRLPKPEPERGRSQQRRGVVVSAAMDKTIVVRVDSVKSHPRYKKVIRRSVKFHAHDERNEAKAGDVVRIVETRPLSKTKRWRLAEIVEAAK